MEKPKQPIDLFNERIRRRAPTDVGGVAITACLREAVEQQRITPQDALERLRAYTTGYAGEMRPEPPDIVA